MLESDTQRRRSHLGRDNKNISVQCIVRSRHINIAFLAFFIKMHRLINCPNCPVSTFFLLSKNAQARKVLKFHRLLVATTTGIATLLGLGLCVYCPHFSPLGPPNEGRRGKVGFAPLREKGGGRGKRFRCPPPNTIVCR